MNCLIDIFPLALVPLLLYGCRFEKKAGLFYDDYLSQETGVAARGFFALTVILHHISQQISGGILFPRFLYIGNLPVSVFFFFSGYGLIRQLEKNRDYGKKVLRKRIVSMLIPFTCVILAVSAIYALIGDPHSPIELVGYVFKGDIFLCILWYFIVISFFYLLFGVFAVLFRGNTRLTVCAMLAGYILYTLLIMKINAGEWFCNTSHVLIIGMLWALCEKKLLRFTDRFYYPLVLLCIGVFGVIFTQYDRIFALSPTPAMHLLIALVRNASFTLGFVLVTRKLKIKNSALTFLGSISLELYAVHIVMLKFFHCDLCFIENNFAYAALVLSSTILISFAIHTAFRRKKT